MSVFATCLCGNVSSLTVQDSLTDQDINYLERYSTMMFELRCLAGHLSLITVCLSYLERACLYINNICSAQCKDIKFRQLLDDKNETLKEKQKKGKQSMINNVDVQTHIYITLECTFCVLN